MTHSIFVGRSPSSSAPPALAAARPPALAPTPPGPAARCGLAATAACNMAGKRWAAPPRAPPPRLASSPVTTTESLPGPGGAACAAKSWARHASRRVTRWGGRVWWVGAGALRPQALPLDIEGAANHAGLADDARRQGRSGPRSARACTRCCLVPLRGGGLGAWRRLLRGARGGRHLAAAAPARPPAAGRPRTAAGDPDLVVVVIDHNHLR